MNIETQIAGIPCQVQVDHCFVQKPLGPDCDSDWDCYGYSEVEFTVLDRKGYPARWLEAKMSPEDSDRITDEILKEITNEY